MYCIGPANVETLPMLELLCTHRASVTLQNNLGQTAMAYAKAWKASDERRAVRLAPVDLSEHIVHVQAMYDMIIKRLVEGGCDPGEPSAF
jgi:hypothetical protein